MSLLYQWSRGLRFKLLILAGIPIFIICIVAYEGMIGAKTLGHDLEMAVNDDLPTTMYRGEMDAAIHAGIMWLLKASTEVDNIEGRNKDIEHAEHEIARFIHAEEEYEKEQITEGEKKLYQPIHEYWPKAQSMMKEAIVLLKKHNETDNTKAKTLIQGDLIKALKPIDEAFESLDQFQLEHLAEQQKHSIADEKRVYRNIFIFAAIGFIFSLAFSITLANKLAKTINNITKSLNLSSEQVALASNQIAETSNELSQSTMEQSASLEETTAALEEINAMVGRSAESANSTAQTTLESQNKAEQGRAAMDQMLTSIDEITHSNEEIKNQIQDSNHQMAEIVKVILEIGNKTKVINDIVFQTKLLSFNASVEAARAGEQGKGFAVVAEEVGSLAQMSGNAAKEISDLLHNSISKVEGIVEETKNKVEQMMVQSKSKVDAGSVIAKKCSELLNEIVQNASQVASLSKEISQASHEQSKGVSEISKAMSQLDTVTQQNAAAGEEAASAAEELSGQAESLKDNIKELQSIIEGGSQVQQGSLAKVIPIETKIKKPGSTTAANGEKYPSWEDKGFKEV